MYAIFVVIVRTTAAQGAGSGDSGAENSDLESDFADDWLIILLYALASCAVLLLLFFICFYIFIYKRRQQEDEEEGALSSPFTLYEMQSH